MTLYRYRAARGNGRITSGELAADSPAAASALLASRGLAALSMTPARAPAQRRSAGRRELAIVFRSLASLVQAGLPLERAIASSTPLARGALKEELLNARQAIHQGAMLSSSLGQAGTLVPAVTIGIIRAGERSSRLSLALDRAASQLEREAELIGKVRQALAYPLMLAVTGSVSVVVIGTVVVPRFATLLDDMGQTLPASTRILLAASSVLSAHGLVILALLLGLAITVALQLRAPVTRAALDRFLLQLPLIGRLRLALAGSRFCRALASGLEAGMPMLQAFDAGGDAAGDLGVEERAARARDRIARGEPVAGSLDKERVIPAVCVQLLSVGEAGGQLAAMAHRASDIAEAKAERSLRSAIALIEPAFIVMFGGLVIFVAMALLQAVYGLRPS